jgi:excisionase family DNA binding protein
MSDHAFTVNTLAEHWACSPDIVYDMIRQKKIKAFKLGRVIRISAEEVARYEKEN